MALTLTITVVGLRVAGLVLIVALTIIPPVAARFWTNRPGRMVAIAAGVGGVSAYVGAVVSSLDANLPTGALIVLVSFAVFLVSLICSPLRGVLAGRREAGGLRRAILLRQGLLDLAAGRKLDAARRAELVRCGYLKRDGSTSLAGERAVGAVAEDERLRAALRRQNPQEALGFELNLRPRNELLPAARLTELRSEHPGGGAR